MSAYRVWIRLNAYQTAHVIVYAENDAACRLVAEAQYGTGSVLNYTLIEN